MQTELLQLRSKLDQEKGKLSQLLTDKQLTEDRLKFGLELREDIEEAQIIIQTVAQEIQNQITDFISDMVTAALNAVFDNSYEFKLSFVLRRGKTEADLKFIRNGYELDPLDDSGGGIINVGGIALRVGLWSLAKNTRNVILCDEPVHFLHDSRAQERFSELFSSLSKELWLQIIMISGEENSEIIEGADRVFRLELVDGISQVEVEDN